MSEGSGKARKIDLGDDFGDVVVKVNGIGIEVGADKTVKVNGARVEVKPAANDAASPNVGDVERDGDHKGEIYGGIWPREYDGDNRPIWFNAAPKVMDHYKAAAWAKEQGGSLATRKQGDYLTTLKGKGGALTELFNRGNSFPAGSVWLAEPGANIRLTAWCQRLSDGYQSSINRFYELPVLSVRR